MYYLRDFVKFFLFFKENLNCSNQMTLIRYLMLLIRYLMTLIRYIPDVSNDAKSIVSGWPESQFSSPTEVRSIEDSWNTDRGTRVLSTGFLIISWFCFSCKKRRIKELYKLYIVKCIHIEFKYSKTKCQLKQNCRAVTSPKKPTNEFVFLSWRLGNTWNLKFKFQVF